VSGTTRKRRAVTQHQTADGQPASDPLEF
jgi:hypothetical protein